MTTTCLFFSVMHYVPVDTLHTLTPPGFPLHMLRLRVGARVCVLRNISNDEGLMNGTIMLVARLTPHAVMGFIET